MRTNYVLIDLESVQPETLTVLSQDHFKVIVFVGATQAKLPFELAVAMQRFGDRAEYVKIAGTGPNALDFHIAFYIGQLATQDPTPYFHIISKDTGFDPLIQHLKSKNIFSARSAKIDDIPLVKVGNKKSPEERAQMIIAKLQEPKVTRPRKEKTLSSAVAHFFQKQLTEQEVTAVIAELQRTGFLTVIEGKVSYAQGG